MDYTVLIKIGASIIQAIVQVIAAKTGKPVAEIHADIAKELSQTETDRTDAEKRERDVAEGRG